MCAAGVSNQYREVARTARNGFNEMVRPTFSAAAITLLTE
jgi:hypothetical protein